MLTGDLIVKVPNSIRAIGDEVKDMPEYLMEIIDECNNDLDIDEYITNEAFLSKAVLKSATGGAKDIIRVFETKTGEEFELSNFEYSLIEKHNGLRYYETDKLTALVIYSGKNRGSVEALIVRMIKEEN